MTNTQVWMTIAGAFIAALPGLLALVSQSRKDKADAGKTANDAAVAMINQLQEENASLRLRQSELEVRIFSQAAEYDARLEIMEQKVTAVLKEKAASEQERARLESENLDLRRTIWAYQEGLVGHD